MYLPGLRLCHGLQETQQTAPDRAPGRTWGQQDPPQRSYCKKSMAQNGHRHLGKGAAIDEGKQMGTTFTVVSL